MEITDEEKLAVLLSGAGERYEAVVTMIELASESGSLSYSAAVEKLKDFSVRGDRVTKPDGINGVLAVKKSLDEIKCYQCGKLGHYKRNCPDKKRIGIVKDVTRW